MSEATASQVRKLAMDYLARREHGYAELLTKVKQRGVPGDLAQEELQKLADEGLQDDSRFADMYTRAQAKRGKGPLYIINGLTSRELESSEAERAIRRSQLDWAASAVSVAHKKFPHGYADSTEKAKGLRFLQQRGFTAEQATKAMRSLKS